MCENFNFKADAVIFFVPARAHFPDPVETGSIETICVSHGKG